MYPATAYAVDQTAKKNTVTNTKQKLGYFFRFINET